MGIGPVQAAWDADADGVTPSVATLLRMAAGKSYFDAVVDEREGATVVVATGEIDAASCEKLEACLDGLPSDATVRLDLSGVSFIDSSGLRVVTAAARSLETGGGTLTVSAASESVERVFAMTGLGGLIAG